MFVHIYAESASAAFVNISILSSKRTCALSYVDTINGIIDKLQLN